MNLCVWSRLAQSRQSLKLRIVLLSLGGRKGNGKASEQPGCAFSFILKNSTLFQSINNISHFSLGFNSLTLKTLKDLLIVSKHGLELWYWLYWRMKMSWGLRDDLGLSRLGMRGGGVDSEVDIRGIALWMIIKSDFLEQRFCFEILNWTMERVQCTNLDHSWPRSLIVKSPWKRIDIA